MKRLLRTILLITLGLQPASAQIFGGVYGITGNLIRQIEIYDVMSFANVVCDNAHDDTAGIQAVIDAIRSSNGNTYGTGDATLYFPESRKCLIKSTLNFTGIRFQGFKIRGGFIDCQTTASPCLDFSGSAMADISHLTIVSNGTANIGVQLMAPNTGGGSQLFHFTDLIVIGGFSVSALYNLGAEAAVFENCAFINTAASATAYSVIQDGYNHFGVSSAFTSTSIGVDAGTTFDHDVFHGVQIQNTGGGGALWIGNAAHHEFSGYIVVAASVPAITVFTETAAGGLGNIGMKFNTHVESAPTGIFRFMSAGTLHTPTIFGFEYNELNNQTASSTFVLDASVTGLTINDINLHIWKNNGGGSKSLFDTPASYTISGGYIYLPNASDWTAPAAHHEVLCLIGTCTYN